MKIFDYIKIIFEDDEMSSEYAEAILWGCTGYPSFWNGNSTRCLTKQLYHAKRSLARGFTIDQISSGDDVVYNESLNQKQKSSG